MIEIFIGLTIALGFYSIVMTYMCMDAWNTADDFMKLSTEAAIRNLAKDK